eukprot:gnl/MRDRNA2_/MRDRNA2_243977_c0_seq1.p1 gnl/MRDRNA2_/MRDRNA2_243977_c0~~gnl/MRDRNA2_/MRDRNA2_243977_c0_seq1.p1  ORF type:complete len:124 (+),score=14.53 gnl/MRDRNA2_/MRDRNA2_243977_c0_seq1:467-838(+)
MIEAEPQNTKSSIMPTFEELFEKVHVEVSRLQDKNDHSGFEELMLEIFRKYFAECTNDQDSRTTLSRKEYQEPYGSMNCYGLWRRMYERYHGGTGHPLKNKEFLEMMYILHSLWTKCLFFSSS